MKNPARPACHLSIASNAEQMSRRTARLVETCLETNPQALLGLATGSTPTRAYQLLSQTAARQPARFRSVRVLKLDEWGGLAMEDPATSETYLRQHVVGPWNIAPSRFFGWNSCPSSRSAECARMSAWLRQHGPIDLCILGLGVNGHILFNEPDDALAPEPHVARLSPESLGHGMLLQAQRRPRFGLTLGFADLLQSRCILLVASGPQKARPLARMLQGPVTTQCPASFLRLHPDLHVLCDQAAARSLRPRTSP